MAEVEAQERPHVEIQTVARVYLKDPDLARRSAYHTAYVGGEVMPNGEQRLYTLHFWRGVTQNVPQNVYDRFYAAGMVTTDRPPRRYGENDL